MRRTPCSSERAAITRRQAASLSAGSTWRRIRPIARAAGALLVPLLGACQASMQTRRTIAPGWRAEAPSGRTSPVGSRLRFEGYVLADFQGSAATRRWPLLDGHTTSHRYGFVLRESGVAQRDVRCVLLTIAGDTVRAGSRLECAVAADSSARDGDWTLRLTVQPALQVGTLTRDGKRYEVRAAAARDLPLAGVDARGSGYVVLDGTVPVATVQVSGGRAVWLDPVLGSSERGVLAATLFALVLGHELGIGT